MATIWAPSAGAATSEDFARERSLSVEERRQAARVTARQRASDLTVLGIVLVFPGILLQASSPRPLLLVSVGVVQVGVALQPPSTSTAHRAQHRLDTTCP